METLLNVLQFVAIGGGILVGGYHLLKKFAPEVVLQIKAVIDGLLDKIKRTK